MGDGPGRTLPPGYPPPAAIGKEVVAVINTVSSLVAARPLESGMSQCSPLRTIEAAVRAAASDGPKVDVVSRLWARSD